MTTLPVGPFGERVRTRLRDEYVIWLVTVGADGAPQPNPVWFIWDGDESLVVYNRASAHRLQHIAARPTVSLHFDGNGRGGDVVVLTATATSAALPPAHENSDYLEKYADGMRRVSGSPEQFSADYPVPLRFQIRRVRGS